MATSANDIFEQFKQLTERHEKVKADLQADIDRLKAELEDVNAECSNLRRQADRRYNGWTNYETWLAYTWLSNDEHSYRHWEAVADSALENNDDDYDGVSEIANELKEVHQESFDMLITCDLGLLHDLAQGALDEIDFYDIGRHLLDDARERADN